MAVFFRTTGRMHGLDFVLRTRGWGLGRVPLPVTVAVLERPEGITLIDTGWSRRTCAFPADDPGRATALLLGLDVHPEDAMASQLISAGLSPDDVRHVIATHLHIDHVGGIVDFPHATLHTTVTEWGCVSRGRFRGYNPNLRDVTPRTAVHSLGGPAALGFESSHDVFGDGSVLMLDAHGHTAGSVAVAVRLGDGWLVHAGDAVMFREDYSDRSTSTLSLYARGFAQDVEGLRVSRRALHTAEKDHGARVVPSHDAAVYESLPHGREDAWIAVWDRKPRGQQAPKAPRRPSEGGGGDKPRS